MENPIVSIVMPVKNTAQFLVECLDSILLQTYSHWELLACDDGSSDDSLEILNNYAEKDSRINIFVNEGQGIIDALRLAYSKSSGALITRMDSDDVMAKEKLAELSGNLQAAGKGNIAIGLVKYFSDEKLGEGFKKYESWLNGLTRKGSNFEERYKECVIPSPCWMVHRSDLELCNAFRPDRYPEDYDLTFRFFRNGLKPIPTDKVLHHWRDSPLRASRTHEHYADNTFLNLKCHYFLALDYKRNQQLVLWGAGKKGKTIASILVAEKIDFRWICNNPNKIGQHIYGQALLPEDELDKIENPQVIIAIANPESQEKIKSYLQQRKDISPTDCFFFC